jgi:hypothetical protein
VRRRAAGSAWGGGGGGRGAERPPWPRDSEGFLPAFASELMGVYLPAAPSAELELPPQV